MYVTLLYLDTAVSGYSRGDAQHGAACVICANVASDSF